MNRGTEGDNGLSGGERVIWLWRGVGGGKRGGAGGRAIIKNYMVTGW